MSSAATRDQRSCLSLPHALCAVARAVGLDVDLYDLCAAMGLSFLPTSISGEPCADKRSMYARDAFLIQAGRLFGMTIREIHPPEAALGIAELPEFDQHFDASYRPLIERALEHDQPVLAWQGWPGERALHWGVITETCTGGIGLAGWVPGTVASCSNEAALTRDTNTSAESSQTAEVRGPDVTLERPPVQVYVVESIAACKPDTQELRDMAITHAKVVLNNGLADRFGVTTGQNVYDDWIERLRACDAKLPTYLLDITDN